MIATVRPQPRVSQQSIAKELGVSQALVSLALNGRREGINPDTYRRIWEHAMQAGYQPKGIRLERSPEDTRTRQIGVILRSALNLHTQGSYFSHVMHGLHSALRERGYTTAFFGSEDNLDAKQLCELFGPGHAVHGVVMLGEVDPRFLPQLRQHNTRLVAVSARHPGLCHSVVGNEPQALDSLVDHLADLGHQRIGWIGGNVGLGRHEMRFQALRSALERRGLRHDPRYDVKQRQGDRAEGAEAMMDLLSLAHRRDFPTAFVTYNVQMAIGAIRSAQRAGRRVPDDLSIAAADYSQAALDHVPTVTAAGCDPEKLGHTAARLVLDEDADAEGSLHDLLLASQLHPGGSTAPARAG